MKSINELSRNPDIRSALAEFQARLDDIVEQVIAIQQIPAPTFEEEARARFIEERFKALGIEDVNRDALNNVYGRLPGTSSALPPVVLSAHLDTVIPINTD